MNSFATTYRPYRFSRFLATALLLCLWAVTPAAGHTKTPEKDDARVRQFIEKGLKAFDQKKYDAAIQHYNRALELDPKSTWALNLRGNARLESGRVQKALEDFGQCLLIAPHYAAAYRNRALAFFKLGQTDRSLADLNQAIHFDPKHAGIFLQRGRLKSELSDYNGALADYRKAMETGLAEDAILFDRGVALFGLDNHVQAYRDFSRHLLKKPQNTAAMILRARCRIALGLYKGLETDFKVIDDPNFARLDRDAMANEKARFLAAAPHDDIRDPGRALAIAEGLVERNPKNHFYLDTLAMALASERRYPRAAKTQMMALNQLQAASGAPATSELIRGYKERLGLYKHTRPFRLRPLSGPKFDRIIFYNWKSARVYKPITGHVKEELGGMLASFSPPLMLTDKFTRRLDLADLAVSCRVTGIKIRKTKANRSIKFQVEVPPDPVAEEKPPKPECQIVKEKIETIEKEIGRVRRERKNALALAKSSGGAEAPSAVDNRAMSVVDPYDRNLKSLSIRKAELETQLALNTTKPEPPPVKKKKPAPPPQMETRSETAVVPAKSGEIRFTLQFINALTGKNLYRKNLKAGGEFAAEHPDSDAPGDEAVREGLAQIAADMIMDKLMVQLGVDEGYPNLLN